MTDFAAARTAMVDRQVRPSDVTRLSVIEAMLAAPREAFVPRAARPLAYAGAPVQLAEGRWLMEARNFAKMIDAAELSGEELVLIVGAGMGYGAAVAARMAAAVVALEENEDLAERARTALSGIGAHNVVVETGALSAGHAEAGPYDVILVEGGVRRPGEALMSQLAPDGRLLAFEQDGPVGRCALWRRIGGVDSHLALFDAPMPLLPGFDDAPAFVF